LGAETQRARVAAVAALRTQVAAVQDRFLSRIDAAGGAELRRLPDDLDVELQAVAARLSQDLRDKFQTIGERALARVFDGDELASLLGRVNATLRHALSAAGPRDAGGDQLMVALSAGGIAFMAGRGAMFSASVFGLAAGGLLVPFAGLGLGLAAGGYVLWRRRVQTDRQQARAWLREVLAEARAALADEISHRFTDLQYALTTALDDAVERRLQELDAHVADLDAAMAQDKAARARRRAAIQADRDAARAQLSRVDQVLARAQTVATAGLAPGAGARTPGARTPGARTAAGSAPAADSRRDDGQEAW
jgi:hypothetical protein